MKIRAYKDAPNTNTVTKEHRHIGPYGKERKCLSTVLLDGEDRQTSARDTDRPTERWKTQKQRYGQMNRTGEIRAGFGVNSLSLACERDMDRDSVCQGGWGLLNKE